MNPKPSLKEAQDKCECYYCSRKECKYCKGDLTIRNPKGFCDHLYYPESCKVCSKKSVVNWICGKCYQEENHLKGEPIPKHFRTCPKRFLSKKPVVNKRKLVVNKVVK